MKKFKNFLEGSQIYLREVNENDVSDAYYGWMNDSEVNQYLETRYIPRSKANILNFVKNLDSNSNEILFAICDIKSNKRIGNIKLGPINWIHKFGDISLLIGEKDYWGRGIATEAIALVSVFAFNTLNMHKLKAGCYSANEGSLKAFEKVGFNREGLVKKQWFVNGVFQDNIILGLCSEDFDFENLFLVEK